jgi:diguanylate cyclase (GGDEF)-like protein
MQCSQGKQKDFKLNESSIPKKKILVVDDDKIVGDTIKNIIVKFGYDCKTARNGSEASKKTQKEPFDVIITDIKMPKMGGIELLHRIKNEHREIDVLIMTGYEEEYTFTEVIKEGATDFISKPFQNDELEAKLHRIMRERELKEELVYLSIRDSLTGLFNRRHFFQNLQQEMERAKRQKRALSLILLDIDNFKQYNDSLGHLEGDKALDMLAKILQSSLRQNVDSAYRYGGDEFAALLIETTMSQAVQIADRIRASYEKEKMGLTTLSLGLTEYRPPFDVETFVRETDEALYRAKRAGGNQVVPNSHDQESLRDSGIAERAP